MHPQLTPTRLTTCSFNFLYVFNLATGLYIFYLIPLTFLQDPSTTNSASHAVRYLLILTHFPHQLMHSRELQWTSTTNPCDFVDTRSSFSPQEALLLRVEAKISSGDHSRFILLYIISAYHNCWFQNSFLATLFALSTLKLPRTHDRKFEVAPLSHGNCIPPRLDNLVTGLISRCIGMERSQCLPFYTAFAIAIRRVFEFKDTGFAKHNHRLQLWHLRNCFPGREKESVDEILTR
jgi:hypothetical protein